MTISFNPALTSNAAGGFSVQSTGYIQGMMIDEPATRFQLAGGILATAETLPMWGGVAIVEALQGVGTYQNSAQAANNVLGNTISRALTTATITGFSVLNQQSAAIVTPQSNVPTEQPGQTVNFFRFGSGAKIAVQCDPALAAALQTNSVSTQVSWDLGLQKLISYEVTTAANVFTAMSWASTAGGTVTATTTSNHGLTVGQWFTVSGVVPAAYNGTFQVATTNGTTGMTFLLPAASTPGTVTTQGQINALGGALPVKVIGLNIGNSKIVVWDSVNQVANFANTGTTAIIEI
jgi:hypothetical protein